MATRLPAKGVRRIGLNGDLRVAHGTISRKGFVLLRDDRESSGWTTPGTRYAANLGVVRLWEQLRARVSAMDPFRVDVMLAALAVVGGTLDLALVVTPDGNQPVTMVAGVVALSSVAWRRRDPLIAAAVFAVPTVSQALLGGYLMNDSTAPFIVLIFLFYSVGRHAEGRRLVAAASLLFAGSVAGGMLEGGLVLEDVFWVLFMFGLPLLAGRALRSRVLLQAELRDKAEQAERDRRERAQGAVEDERVRIAAELQALVANGLSAMVVQAETVPRALAAGDGASAGAAFAAVEETGRDALMEMRRLLGVLRRDEDGAQLAPQPGLARLEALVERNRERGLEVELRVEGNRRELSPGVDLTAYRVIEDALEAATEKEADRADVTVRYRDGELQLQVSDDRDGGASDRLPGLRERVGLYGGHLGAGPRDEGGFRLRANLPLEGGG
jgi:signal transduction histidine kinase